MRRGRRPTRRLLAVAALLVTLAAAWAAADPSPLFAPRPSALRFSHQRHDARGIDCLRCHPAARSSRSAVDLLLPTEAPCRACHPVDRQAPSAEACGKCHLGFAVAAPVPRVWSLPPALKHSHAAHAQLPCARCHALPAGDDAARPAMPSMPSCLSCHPDGRRAERCTACHLASPAGTIDVTLGNFAGAPDRRALTPRTDLFGDAHGPGFASDHRAAALRPDRTCSACHEESYCTDCHVGTTRPMAFHPDDYLQIHALEARRAASECSTCHRLQSFCVGCHERVGVGTRAASEFTGEPGGRAFHPAGWAARDRGAGDNQHAREARRNLATCASCHREDECLPCHSADAAGLRITPHPPGWRDSARCRALDRANRRMCLRCHVTPDELGCAWRAAR